MEEQEEETEDTREKVQRQRAEGQDSAWVTGWVAGPFTRTNEGQDQSEEGEFGFQGTVGHLWAMPKRTCGVGALQGGLG